MKCIQCESELIVDGECVDCGALQYGQYDDFDEEEDFIDVDEYGDDDDDDYYDDDDLFDYDVYLE